MLAPINAALEQSIAYAQGSKRTRAAAVLRVSLVLFSVAAVVLIASFFISEDWVLRRRGSDIPLVWAFWITAGVVASFGAYALTRIKAP